MRPLRLLLDGFGSYRRPAEADFSDVDYFALTGPTGAGKSTVIDGICFALYGAMPRWDGRNAISQAPGSESSDCRVALVFEASGKRYAAVRTLACDQGKTEARLNVLDGSVPADAPLTEILDASVDRLAEGPDQVTAAVQELLGLSYEHFTQSVLLPQGRFADFLQAEPEKRPKLLMELLAFGVYGKIGQLARERADQAADQAQAAQRERNELSTAARTAEESASAKVEELDTLISTVESRVNDLAALTEQSRLMAEQAEATRANVSLLASMAVPTEITDLAAKIARADQLVVTRRQLADDAHHAALDAQQVRDDLPDRHRAESFRKSYEKRRSLVAQLDREQRQLATRLDTENARLAAAETLQRRAEQVQAAQLAAAKVDAVYALAVRLRPGQRCAVCQQQVIAQPHPQVPRGMREIRTVAESAEANLDLARDAHAAAAAQAAVARVRMENTRQQLDEVEATLADAPDESEAGNVLTAIAEAETRLRGAREDARTARVQAQTAESDRAALADKERSAWDDLRRARDPVAGLGAPGVAEPDLAAAWSALAGWADGQHAEQVRRLTELETAADARQDQVAAVSEALHEMLADHDVDVTELANAPAAVATLRSQAVSDLVRIARDRERIDTLDEQIIAAREEQLVAGDLGKLLQSASFERWLCSEALDSLIAEASVTLKELSGGRYQLDKDDRSDLVVIDYQDAGARRPVHTLSGGETFQASLAMALALSGQAAGLSAGTRYPQSLFLDEGFGTLDEESLDTVATTLERLAADESRIVGLVTHIPALADRVPVRFVVTRDATGSSLRKER
jgi:DNA repair protein SbcC/Rad50